MPLKNVSLDLCKVYFLFKYLELNFFKQPILMSNFKVIFHFACRLQCSLIEITLFFPTNLCLVS